MIQFVRVSISDSEKLAQLSTQTFWESHGHCGPKADVEVYANNRLNETVIKTELSDPHNIFYMMYQNDTLVGYSKIIYNSGNINHSESNITKMERLYILNDFLGSGLAALLFDFNIQLAKDNDQKGIWLNVWVENHRAISFYKKNGFTKIGDYMFRVSEKLANPNHVMYLAL